MKKILSGIDWLTSHPVYQLIVSISLVIVSIYDSVKVILKDISNLDMRKEHFILLVGILMLINAVNTLFKGVKGLRKSVEEIEEEEHTKEMESAK